MQNILLGQSVLDNVGGGGGGGDHLCVYCMRQFHFKDVYVRHVLTCEFFYRRRRDRERDDEAIEVLPSAQEQFKLVQYLTLQVAKLQREVISLKGTAIARKKRLLIQWLQSAAGPKPVAPFLDWIKQIPVTFDHLDQVFRGDLTDGMKVCIRDWISQPGSGDHPLCAFLQKPGTIYVWTVLDEVNGPGTNGPERSGPMHWTILSTELFDRWMNRLAHRFLQEFIQWQMVNSEKIHATDEDKERNIEYMRKINGLGAAYETRRRSELRKWLYVLLAKDFVQTDYE